MALQLQVNIDSHPLQPQKGTGDFLFSADLAAHLNKGSSELKYLNIATPQFEQSIPIIFRAGFPGRRIIMPQYLPYFKLNSPSDPSLSVARSTSVQRHVSTAIAKALDDVKPVLIELNFLPFYWLPFHWAGYDVKPRITYRLETKQSTTDELLSGFRENIRRQIKKSVNEHSVVVSENSDALFDLNRESYQRKGDEHPFDPEILNRLNSFVGDHQCGQIIEIHNSEGKAIAAALFAWDNDRIYYLTGGIRESEKSSGAMARVMWEGIQLAHSKSRCFDFEGSMNPGIEQFFSSFGATPFTYYQVRKTNSKLYDLYQSFKS